MFSRVLDRCFSGCVTSSCKHHDHCTTKEVYAISYNNYWFTEITNVIISTFIIKRLKNHIAITNTLHYHHTPYFCYYFIYFV